MSSRIVPILLVLAGCHAPSESSPAQPIPPPPKPDLEITIELATQPSLEVRYRTSATAAPDGATTFKIDDRWGGVEDAASLVLDPRFSGEGGRALAAEQPNPNEWLVRSEPGERVEAAWRLAPNDYRANSDPRVHYHPILDAGLDAGPGTALYHAIGHLAFLVPRIDDETPLRIAVRWKGFQEAGWTVAASLGNEPRGFEGTMKLQDVLHAVYLAGPDLRVLVRDVHGKPVSIAIAGTSWTFTDADFAEAVRSIVDTERTFFADDDFPTYLVSVIPVGKANPQSRSLGGTGLTRSFACFLQPDTKLGLNAGEEFGVPHLLAHEMFHHWNGGLTSMEEPEQLVYWFSEGFTEFYARRILHRSGIGGTPEAARSLNQALKEYYLSPVRDEPGERIRQDFWKDQDVGKLPYLRGDLVAVLLDREIRRKSNDARSLDDFMREVVDAGRRGEKLGNDSLLRRIEAWTSPEFAGKIRSIVIDGATLALDASTFDPCLELATERIGRFDLGFDLEASRAAKSVTSVRKGSAAERAGLKEGQRLKSLSIAFGDPTRPVEIGVADEDGDRKLSWLPQADPIEVPQVRPRDGADCARL
jgi:predicted metalloprotease with PDZ domain